MALHLLGYVTINVTEIIPHQFCTIAFSIILLLHWYIFDRYISQSFVLHRRMQKPLINSQNTIPMSVMAQCCET